MAKVLSNEAEEVVCKKRRKVLGIKCDKCGKEISPYQFAGDESKYYRVMTGHHEWGNDSCESIEYKDICPECIAKFVDEYLKNGRDSAYIEIETEHVWDNSYEYE